VCRRRRSLAVAAEQGGLRLPDLRAPLARAPGPPAQVNTDSPPWRGCCWSATAPLPFPAARAERPITALQAADWHPALRTRPHAVGAARSSAHRPRPGQRSRGSPPALCTGSARILRRPGPTESGPAGSRGTPAETADSVSSQKLTQTGGRSPHPKNRPRPVPRAAHARKRTYSAVSQKPANQNGHMACCASGQYRPRRPFGRP